MHYWLRGWTPQSPLVYRNTLLKSKLISKFSKTLTKFRDGEIAFRRPRPLHGFTFICLIYRRPRHSSKQNKAESHSNALKRRVHTCASITQLSCRSYKRMLGGATHEVTMRSAVCTRG